MLGIAGALSCTLWASAEAQTPSAPPLPTVNSAAMDAHRKYLADDLLEGRAPATRGGELAARYIAAQFEALGLAPGAADGSYYQPVTLVGLTPHPTMRWGVAPETTFPSLSRRFRRVVRAAISIESGIDFVGRPAGWGEEQSRIYNEERYHRPSDEYHSDFRYDGMVQQVRVMLRLVRAVANDSGLPKWLPSSEFQRARWVVASWSASAGYTALPAAIAISLPYP